MYPVGNSKDLWNIMQSTMTFSKALQKKLIKRRKRGQNSFITLDFYWLGVRGLLRASCLVGFVKNHCRRFIMRLMYVFTLPTGTRIIGAQAGYPVSFVVPWRGTLHLHFQVFFCPFYFLFLRRWCDHQADKFGENQVGSPTTAQSLFVVLAACKA